MKPTTVASNSVFIENGLVEIFGQDLSLGELPVVWESAVRSFGLAETRGMFLRSGRAAFYYWLRENGDSLGWREVDFRLLPVPARIKRVLADAMKWFSDESFLEGVLSSTGENWQISATGMAGEGARMECNYFIGMLQEMVCWAGAGKFYPARKIECQSDGVECCLIEISKQPVG
jgi:hypothetical protein